MPFKTIMVLLNDSSRTEQLLDAASALARQFDAHLVGLYILPTAKIYADVGLVATPMVFEGYRDLFKSKLAEVRKKFEARAKQDGLKAEWRTVNSIFPEIAESAIAHSRSAELVVTSQIDYGPDGSIEQDFVVRLVMESGRPVLIIPRKGSFAPRGEGIAEKAIVGINGTKESTRAMFDALPLLRLVKETRLVWVDPYKESEAAGSVPGAEEAAVLARHGIKAVAEPMMTDGYNAGEALLMRANDLGADLLVMGAYAHSRMREFVFGGATRHVLEHMTIPVLMSH
ncbi:MAG TPA: universal stress protein [Aestuariivirga sp.]|jgi:nucleotide-binding universal stress UspA family protein|nr:universal stress protein [Hyphomicrobiales bacterium]MCC7481688.1 universal stress protein [Hyphomicrobiales bacterium]HQY73422.1 universal stress protein [Aestuariivirga sp.]HRA93125.1 universal stress protein [Aestuariivirga sp.]